MVQMKRATPKDREAILKIWGAEFGDGAEFIDPFIAWCGWDHIFLLWEEGKPCAMTAAPLMKLIAARGWDPVFICESDGTQAHDAAAMNALYLEAMKG